MGGALPMRNEIVYAVFSGVLPKSEGGCE